MSIVKEPSGLWLDKYNLRRARQSHSGIAANLFAADHTAMAAPSCLRIPMRREMS
jgi:hypothetical protein